MIEAKPSVESVAKALSAAVPTLDPAEQRLALRLYRMLLAGKPVTTADLAARAGMQARLVEAALGRWPGVFRDRKGRIVGFWGLAIRGMPHRFATEAGEITTWCALDPMLIAPLVTEAALVESADPVSGEQIRLTVTPGGVHDISPPGAVVSMLAPDGPFGHDIVQSFCHFVHFFASERTAQAWVAAHPGTFLLSLDDAFEVASRSWPAIFRDALAASSVGDVEDRSSR
jgi:alkylmercury lyase